IAIKGAGVACVIAPSFARIFYRNCFNMGLPIFESADIDKKVREGDRLEVDAETGVIKNVTRGETYQASPIPPFMQELVASGGLLKFLRKRMEKGRGAHA
ncbi:MAG: 3-isopropylmalate dehydratase small subunit, partial [Candidatus Methylomirabilis sp.]|nr:3-isopropylmalate dehydratase small subunit [Deltaproteobacteria bacterium]